LLKVPPNVAGLFLFHAVRDNRPLCSDGELYYVIEVALRGQLIL
jgi:hypothetical protein